MSCTIPTEIIQQTIAYHGHSCPGVTIGIRAAELAIRELGQPNEIEMVAISETDMCGVDAIQFITGCTLGKGNFIHRDLGKMAFSFYDRKSGKGFRALLNPASRLESKIEDQDLMAKKKDGSASQEELKRLDSLRQLQQKYFMEIELDQMFIVKALSKGLPRPAKVLTSLICQACGESVMESRTRRYAGQTLCISCFQDVEQKI